jgi:hypothetical protein
MRLLLLTIFTAVGVDMICLSQHPLHMAPLFTARNKYCGT